MSLPTDLFPISTYYNAKSYQIPPVTTSPPDALLPRYTHPRPGKRKTTAPSETVVPLYSTLAAWGLAVAISNYLTNRKAPKNRNPIIERCYLTLTTVTIVYSLVTTAMSIPDYNSDAKQRNLKHALLNVSADIATLFSCLASLVVLLQQIKKARCVDYITTLGTLGAGILGPLSSIGSEEDYLGGPLGYIRFWWIGFLCWGGGNRYILLHGD